MGPGDTDYVFPISITYTALAIWRTDGRQAAKELAETLVDVHGTAAGFPTDGFWFDSYSSTHTVQETCNRIRNDGWQVFTHPSARKSLGAQLFQAVQALDEAMLSAAGRPFLKPLDILFEPSKALEDLEAPARDHPHFIYRVCIVSGIIDRFDFDDGSGTLNGLHRLLTDSVGSEEAHRLTEPFRMIKRLRRQYPIHEQFAIDGDGERQRRTDVMEAERYFGLGTEHGANWNLVLTAFTESIVQLRESVASGAFSNLETGS